MTTHAISNEFARDMNVRDRFVNDVAPVLIALSILATGIGAAFVGFGAGPTEVVNEQAEHAHAGSYLSSTQTDNVHAQRGSAAAGASLGAAGGAYAGAKVGGAVGSVGGPAGTVVGGAIGAGAGAA